MQTKLYFWSEFLKFEYLSPIIPKLGSYNIGLNLAITPKRLSEVKSIIRLCEQNNIELNFWPLLNRNQGYWVNRWNINVHIKWIDFLLNNYPTINAYLLDLEKPINFKGIKGKVLNKKLNKIYPDSKIRLTLNEIVDKIHDYGKKAISTSYGGLSMGLYPRPSNADFYSYMVYTSFFSLISTVNTRLNIIFYTSNKIRKEHGLEKSAIDLGITYGGVVKDKFYEKYIILDTDELAKQIEVCLYTKIKRIHLFALDNLTREIDQVLEKFSNLKPQKPPLNLNGKQGFMYNIYKKRLYKRKLKMF